MLLVSFFFVINAANLQQPPAQCPIGSNQVAPLNRLDLLTLGWLMGLTLLRLVENRCWCEREWGWLILTTEEKKSFSFPLQCKVGFSKIVVELVRGRVFQEEHGANNLFFSILSLSLSPFSSFHAPPLPPVCSWTSCDRTFSRRDLDPVSREKTKTNQFRDWDVQGRGCIHFSISNQNETMVQQILVPFPIDTFDRKHVRQLFWHTASILKQKWNWPSSDLSLLFLDGTIFGLVTFHL